MTNTKTFFLLLSLFMLACTLTAQVTPSPQNGRSAVLLAPKQVRPTQVSTNTNPPQVCKVKTGLSAGRLNLRSCSGLACPVLAVIVEGEILTPTQTKPLKGWLEVQVESPSVVSGYRLRGWVNSKLTTCEVKK